MVCDRCVMVVRQQFDELELQYKNIQLGQVELNQEPDTAKLEQLRTMLQQQGFELLDDKKAKTVERIKTFIVSLIHGKDADELNLKLSAMLVEKLGIDYHYLSSLFSSVEGITIEKYTILQRIEKVKELDYVLTPGRYVGLPDDEDEFDFTERFSKLQTELEAQLKEEDADVKAIKEIEKETKRMLSQFGTQRYIANLGHGVYPDTDPDKVRCFIETVKTYS